MKYISLVLVAALFINVSGHVNDQPSHGLFTEILSAYVHDGKVNYHELCKDDRLPKYIEQLMATNPEDIENDNDRLAFWINAYNAYTLKIICDNYPVKSINDLHTGGLLIGIALKKTIWDKEFVIINNKRLSLNQIEHKIIRPRFKDARIHFALVCAAVSCPPLRSEAYEGYKLDSQLDEQGKIFFAEMDKNYFDKDNKRAYLSKILDWYSDDFGKDEGDVLLYISRFLPADLASAIKANPDQWVIKYTKYDWSLNE